MSSITSKISLTIYKRKLQNPGIMIVFHTILKATTTLVRSFLLGPELDSVSQAVISSKGCIKITLKGE